MACLAAHEQGQDLRKTGKLRKARAKFARCAQSTCPGPIVSDCTQWSSEVQQAIPTVVFAGTGTDGKETSAIKVLLDGMPLVERLDGKAVEVDPGEHTFQFEHSGKSKKETFIIREGERNRVLSISFQEKTEPPVAKPPEKQPPPEPKEPEKPPEPLRSAKGSKPVAPLVIGLAGLGVGLGFGAWALGLKGTVTDKCNTSSHQCSDEQGRDAAKLGTPVATVSTVGTVIGVLGLGTWLLWPSRKETSTAQLDAGPIAGGGMVRWYGSW